MIVLGKGICLISLLSSLNLSFTQGHSDFQLSSLVQNVFPYRDVYFVYLNLKEFEGSDEDKSSIFHTNSQIRQLTTSARSNGIFTIDLDIMKDDFEIRADNLVHKQSKKESLILLFWHPSTMVQRLPYYCQKLFMLLTRTYGSATYKDEDHFILFLPQSIKQALMEQAFVKDLKFKLMAVYNDSPSPRGKVQDVLSVCFYCQSGLPQVMDMRQGLEESLSGEKDPELLFKDYTRNAWGHELQVSAQVRLVFVYAIVRRGDRWYFRRGFGKSIVDGLTSRFNYTYRVHPAMGNGGSGAILANGTWVGSVRDIIDGRCDIGVAVALNYARYKLIGGNSFFYAWVNFIMGRPKHIYTWKAVYLPFNVGLWLSTILAAVVVTIAFKGLARREKLYEFFDYSDSFRRHTLEIIGMTLVEQDVMYPRASPSRVLCTVWLFSALVFTTAYRSKLVTLMTFPLMQTLPRTFHELTESDFKWGLESAAIGGAAHQHFRTSSNPVNGKIYSHMSLERNSQKCFTQGISSNFACITWSTQGEYILHRNFSSGFQRNPLVMSEDLSAIVGSGIAYRKRALFRANFDRVVNSIREMGMADKWKTMDYDQEREDHINWLKAGNRLDGSEDIEEENAVNDALSLQKLTGPFYIANVGLFLSLLCLLVELVVLRINAFLSAIHCEKMPKLPH